MVEIVSARCKSCQEMHHPDAPCDPGKPPEHPLVESIRYQLDQFIKAPVTSASLQRISKFALQASKLLALTGTPQIKDADGLLNSGAIQGNNGLFGGDDGDGNASPSIYSGLFGSASTSPPAETFGTKMFREALALLPSLQQSSKETPIALVEAIAEARAQGMLDVAAALEKKLTGAALDGPRPWGGDSKEADLSKVATVAVSEAIAAHEVLEPQG